MRRPSPALLVACAALVCSLTGTAVASGLITSARSWQVGADDPGPSSGTVQVQAVCQMT